MNKKKIKKNLIWSSSFVEFWFFREHWEKTCHFVISYTNLIFIYQMPYNCPKNNNKYKKLVWFTVEITCLWHKRDVTWSWHIGIKTGIWPLICWSHFRHITVMSRQITFVSQKRYFYCIYMDNNAALHSKSKIFFFLVNKTRIIKLNVAASFRTKSKIMKIKKVYFFIFIPSALLTQLLFIVIYSNKQTNNYY